jgi:hypothetical protein
VEIMHLSLIWDVPSSNPGRGPTVLRLSMVFLSIGKHIYLIAFWCSLRYDLLHVIEGV